LDLNTFPPWKKLITGIVLAASAIAGYLFYFFLPAAAHTTLGWVIVFLFSLPLSVYIYLIFTGTKWEKLVNSLLFIALLNLFPCLYFISIFKENNTFQPTQLIIPVLFLALLAILVCLKLYLFLKPPANTETERTDPQKREIELKLPFDEAFDTCLHMIDQFMYRKIEHIHPAGGKIIALVSNPGPGITNISGFPARSSRITFSLQKTGEEKTKITVTSVAVVRTINYSNGYLRSPVHEENNLAAITVFLKERELLRQEKPGHGNSATKNDVTHEWRLIEPDETAFMSLIIPGLGQNYTGRYLRGIIFMAGVAAGLAFFIVPGIVLWIAGAFDAYRIAQNINDNTLPFIPNKTGMIVFHVSAAGALLYLGFSLVRMGYYPYLG
jgi:hypothetical protein